MPGFTQREGSKASKAGHFLPTGGRLRSGVGRAEQLHQRLAMPAQLAGAATHLACNQQQ